MVKMVGKESNLLACTALDTIQPLKFHLLNNSKLTFTRQPTLACVSAARLTRRPSPRITSRGGCWCVSGCRVTHGKYFTRLCFCWTFQSERPEDTRQPGSVCCKETHRKPPHLYLLTIYWYELLMIIKFIEYPSS